MDYISWMVSGEHFTYKCIEFYGAFHYISVFTPFYARLMEKQQNYASNYTLLDASTRIHATDYTQYLIYI